MFDFTTIPKAEDGHVIDSDYHNSLRSAILVIADQLSVDTGSKPNILTFAPAFAANTGNAEWDLSNGLATRPAAGTAEGWMAVQLPDRLKIKSMTVFGRRSGTPPVGGSVFIFNAKLLRIAIADPDQTQIVLINLPLKDASDPFQVTGTIQVGGTGPAALEEYKLIDNTQYKYVVTATLKNATTEMFAQISAIQVMCS